MKKLQRFVIPFFLLGGMLATGTLPIPANARPTTNAQLQAEEQQFEREQIELRQMQIEVHNMQVAQNRSQRNQKKNQSNSAQAAFLANITTALGLTSAQSAQVNAILTGAGKKFNGVNRNTALTVTGHDDQMAAESDRMWTQIEAVLTPDQLVKLDQHRQVELLTNMTTALALTSDQQAQVKVLFAAELAKDTQIRNDATLTSDEARTKFKLARGDTWTGIKALLTMAQREDLDKLDLAAEVTFLRRSLGLTDAQQTTIKPILQDNQKQNIAVRLDPVVDSHEQADKQQMISDDLWTKIDAALTPAQQRKLETQQGEELEKDMIATLDLTATQQLGLKPLVRALETRLHANRTNALLTPTEKTAKQRADHAAFKIKVEALLTPDQVTKFEAWLAPASKPATPKTVVAQEVAVR